MTDPLRYATLAARLLRERPAGKDSPLDRDAGVSAVAHGIALSRRRRALRLTALVAGFAAAAAVAIFFAVPRSGQATVAAGCQGAACTDASRQTAGPPPHNLDRGQSIVAPASAPTSVVLASGTQITLAAKSALECREDGATQRFALTGGSARLHVAKLHTGERFIVQTPDAEVEVHGTIFNVTIEPETAACGAHTVVAVEEGVVQVRAALVSTMLHAGDRWSGPCAAPAPAAHPAPEPKAPRQAVRASAPPPSPEVTAPAPVTTNPTPPAPDQGRHAVSDLSEQNDLFVEAESARRAGQSAAAVAAYGRLLARFPGGQLAEAASVQRARLLSKIDPSEARSEAKRYLARYPAGFARGEMEALATAP